jgi:8-oxo-dGTP diphosphatase
MSDFERLQFGERVPGDDYRDRPAAFGLARRGDAIACVRVEKEGKSWIDLPGGAIDPGETAQQALVREFREETGLKVAAATEIAHAAQYMRKTDGETVNNLCAFFVADISGEDPAAKSEDDHELVWLDPQEALKRLRHDAHAWAVAAWLRL